MILNTSVNFAGMIAEVIAGAEYDTMLSYCSAFEEAANGASDMNLRNDLRLLADVCSPMFGKNLEVIEFVPHISLGDGRRSPIPEDFSDENLGRLAELIDEVQDARLKGRIANVLWYRKYGCARIKKYRRIAIECYTQMPVNVNSWYARGGRELYNQAVLLARADKHDAQKYLLSISKKLQDALLRNSEPKLTCSLVDFLIDKKLPALDYEGFVRVLEHNVVMPDLDILSIEKYRDSLRQVKRKLGDVDGSLREVIAKAKAVIAYVEKDIQVMDPAIMQGRLEPLLKELGGLPSKFRISQGCDELIASIRRCLSVAYRRGLQPMSHFEGEPIDRSGQIQKVRVSMSGLDHNRALSRFMRLYACDVDNLKRLASCIISKNQLLEFCAMYQVDDEGRPIGYEQGDADGRGGGFAWMMRTLYSEEIKCAVMSTLRPAHEVIRSEHNLAEADLRALVGQSSFVPKDRQNIVSKAIYYGYHADYETAAYLLVPQFEHILRSRLKAAGQNTRHLDFVPEKEGELSMSSLVDLAATVFSDSLAFEIKTLFGKAPEMDLRNRLLHGNIPDCNQSHFIFYIWWLMFKQVCLGTLR